MSSKSLAGVADMVAAERLGDMWGAAPAAPLRLRIHAGRRFNRSPTPRNAPAAEKALLPLPSAAR